MATDDPTVLAPERCLHLLRSHPVPVGRLGVTDGDGQPLIVPVNYLLDGDAVVIRADPDSLVGRRALERPVAFEVDDVDAAWLAGWSVLIEGTARRVSDVVELARFRRLRLQPWASGRRCLYLRIDPERVTGRQLC
ncbi:MAG: pyridoxamine 5'-phosphate oxidase family protein [Egibacteraceae bacterium]